MMTITMTTMNPAIHVVGLMQNAHRRLPLPSACALPAVLLTAVGAARPLLPPRSSSRSNSASLLSAPLPPLTLTSSLKLRLLKLRCSWATSSSSSSSFALVLLFNGDDDASVLWPPLLLLSPSLCGNADRNEFCVSLDESSTAKRERATQRRDSTHF